MVERDVVVIAEKGHDLFGLTHAHHAGIDEDALQLVANRFMDQHGGDSAIDAAGQSADHAIIANLLADALDALILERGHGPVAGAACDGVDEVGDEPRAIGRVHDFRVELDAVEAPASSAMAASGALDVLAMARSPAEGQ